MSKTLTIEVLDARGNKIYESNKVSESQTVLHLKQELVKSCEKIRKKGHGVERVALKMNDPKTGKYMSDKTKKINEHADLDLNKKITLYYKDLGLQVSWTTVFLVEYAGPLFITLALVFLQKLIYGQTFELSYQQKLGAALVVFHYAKREVETIFVHRFSNDTMPAFNIIKNSTHYWILCGFCNMYFFLHPQYTAPAWLSESLLNLIAALFVVFEFLNLMCHITLRNLRKPGSTERGIPRGWGFGLVACANYFYESLAWLSFAIQAQSVGAYLFWLVSTLQMLQWALKKKSINRKQFGDKYKVRKAMFPFLI